MHRRYLRERWLLPAPFEGERTAGAEAAAGRRLEERRRASRDAAQPLLGEAVLTAALPAVVLSVMLSVEYKVARQEMASTLFISMLGSIATISGFIYLVQ